MLERPRLGRPPSSFEGEGPAVLRDGLAVEVRCLSAIERLRIEEWLAGLSDASLADRFFSPVSRSTAFAELVRGASSSERLALVLGTVTGGREVIIAQGEYLRDGVQAPGAEVAFLVADAYQGRGCATLLLHRLARAARTAGVKRFHATVRGENTRMLGVFRQSGFPVTEWSGPTAVEVSFSIVEEEDPLPPLSRFRAVAVGR